MSTRCNIILQVKKEDLGKTIKFDATKLPTPLSEWTCYGNEVGENLCQEVTLKKPFIGIYCHSDGYPDGVGRVLLEKYTDYDTILNLIAGGFCSFVWFDEVRHYANRDKEGWEYIHPIQSDKPVAIGGWTEYAYVFKSGKWYFSEVRYDKDDNDKIGRLKLLNEKNISKY